MFITACIWYKKSNYDVKLRGGSIWTHLQPAPVSPTLPPLSTLALHSTLALVHFPPPLTIDLPDSSICFSLYSLHFLNLTLLLPLTLPPFLTLPSLQLLLLLNLPSPLTLPRPLTLPSLYSSLSLYPGPSFSSHSSLYSHPSLYISPSLYPYGSVYFWHLPVRLDIETKFPYFPVFLFDNIVQHKKSGISSLGLYLA